MAEMTSEERFKLWNEFLERWPLERLSNMTLEEYTHLKSKNKDENDSSFCYWIEHRLKQLGAISGNSSAAIFGIAEYEPSNVKKEKAGFLKDTQYKWMQKYGQTASEAFSTIKNIIVSVANAARNGNFEAIDAADLGNITKWKIAFLYQPQDNIKLPCIYKKEWLQEYTASDSLTPFSQMYIKLLEKKPPKTDIFTFSEKIWMEMKENQTEQEKSQISKTAWLIAPGSSASLWQDFLDSGMMKIGWNEVGDLSAIPNKNALEKKLQEVHSDYSPDSAEAKNPASAASMLWNFVHEVKVGDTIFARDGMSKIIGRGIVKSDYQYGDFGKYHHARKVEWTDIGTWKTPFPCSQWTLYKLSPEHGQQLEDLLNQKEIPQGGNMNTYKNQWNIPLALNTIFYGPPGTGKTHKFTELKKYFCSEKKLLNPQERNLKLIENLNWWEIIALVLLDQNIPLKVPQILEHPLLKAQIVHSVNQNPGCAVWGQLQIHTKDECKTVNYDKARRAEPRVFSKRADSSWEIDKALLQEMRPDLFQALQEYQTPPVIQEIERYCLVTFHQSYSYENFVEGISAKTDEESNQIQYTVEPGIFQKVCNLARQNPDEPYALFIDEINRGNVSGIFGELILLIEENKREGAEEEIVITLPYSRNRFSVPKNLFIIGSMNTADRSIDALDSALRRRFAFVEMPPLPDLLLKEEWKPKYLSLNLADLLKSLNQRVEFLLDRDHCIGHSYFMKVCGNSKEEELNNLRTVFKDQVIPLLEDYFYGDLNKVAMVLGSKFIPKIESLTASCLLESENEIELPEKSLRRVADLSNFTEEDFASLI